VIACDAGGVTRRASGADLIDSTDASVMALDIFSPQEGTR